MKRVVVFLMFLMVTLSVSAQKTSIYVFDFEGNTLISHYDNNSFIEWKTSNDASVLHCVEYSIDSTEIEHKVYNIVGIDDDSLSVIITVYHDQPLVIYFWKDHTQVIYEYKNRYTVITGDLKF